MCDIKLEMNALFNWASPVVFSLIVSFVVSGEKFLWLKNFSNLLLHIWFRWNWAFASTFSFSKILSETSSHDLLVFQKLHLEVCPTKCFCISDPDGMSLHPLSVSPKIDLKQVCLNFLFSKRSSLELLGFPTKIWNELYGNFQFYQKNLNNDTDRWFICVIVVIIIIVRASAWK